MKKILVLVFLISLFVLPVTAKTVDTNVFKATVTKYSNSPDNVVKLLFYESKIVSKNGTGNAIEIFEYYPQQRMMCNAFVISGIKTKKPYINDNTNDNICFYFNKVLGKYYALPNNYTSGYLDNDESLTFSSDFSSYEFIKQNLLKDKIYTWQGKKTTADKVYSLLGI